MNKKIIKLVEERLDLGAKKYGKQNISSDGRDFTLEALEEALDMIVYISARLLEIRERESDG